MKIGAGKPNIHLQSSTLADDLSLMFSTYTQKRFYNITVVLVVV